MVLFFLSLSNHNLDSFISEVQDYRGISNNKKEEKMKNIATILGMVMVVFSACTTIDLANDTPESRECESTHSMVGRTTNFLKVIYMG